MDLETLIHRAVLDAVSAAVEEEAAAAAQRVQTKVSGQVTQIASNVCRKMSLTPCGKDAIQITVSFRDEP